jgi:hypothetical protein
MNSTLQGAPRATAAMSRLAQGRAIWRKAGLSVTLLRVAICVAILYMPRFYVRYASHF